MMPRSLSCPLSPLVLKFAEPVRSASPLRAPPRVFKKKPRPEGNAGRGLCGVRKCEQHRIMTSAVTAPVSGRQSVAHLRQSFRRGPQPKPSPERGLVSSRCMSPPMSRRSKARNRERQRGDTVKDILPINLAVASFALSIFTLWATQFRHGQLKMTQPTLLCLRRGARLHALRPRNARTIQINKHAPMNPAIR